MAGFLRQMDANGDGRLDESEVDERRRGFVTMMAQRSGVKADFPIDINNLEKGIQKAAEAQQVGRTDSNRGSSDDQNKDAKKPDDKSKDSGIPTVPGFGVDEQLRALMAFGDPSSGNSTSYVAPISTSGPVARVSQPTNGSNDRSRDRYREMARSLLRQHDRNRSGALEQDERQGVPGNPGEADTNHDGKLTEDELEARLVSFSRGGRDGGPSRDSNNSRREGPKSPDSDAKQKSGPVLLTEELARKDIDGDGQVSMAEYATSWTDSTAALFCRMDLNNDGYITPRECAQTKDVGGPAVASGHRPAGPAPPGAGPPGAGPSGPPGSAGPVPTATADARPAPPKVEAKPAASGEVWTGW